MKRFFLLFLLSLSVSLMFYMFGRYGFEEFGGLSHISLTGLFIFFPFFRAKYDAKCIFQSLSYSIAVFLPILIVKFDIITLSVIVIYVLFLTFIICNKLKRREIEAEH